jgi:uncharacterized iron-regulated membrane protein
VKVREGVRQTMAWLHGWAGLLLGWVLYVMCLAGSLAVFRPEIGEWMRPETRDRAPAPQAVAAAVSWLQQHADASAWFLYAPGPRTNTVEAVWFHGLTYTLRALDPATGLPALRQTRGGEFFYRLHFELQLPYPWGRLLACLAAAMMLLTLITGVIAHRRIFRDFFTFRPGRGQRAWLDAHNALGVFALPFHIMITFTGLITLFSLAMPWGVQARYGNDSAAMFQDLIPGAISRAPAGRPGTLAPIAPMIVEAERRFGGNVGLVSVLNPKDAASLVLVYQADDAGIATSPEAISFDGTTGRVLADYREARPVVKTYDVAYGLHMARFADPLLRWLYFVSGLMLTAGIATGLILWTVKRRERAPLALGNRLVERLNIGMIAGAPTAFAAYFWANRLLPLGGADRAAAEVASLYWTWAAMLLVAFALKPRLGWPILLAAAGVAWAALPLADITVRGAATPVLADGDATMMVVGLAFLAAARHATRRSRA